MSGSTPVVSTTPAAPAKPETWTQEAWDLLVEGEQWVVADLHEIGLVFTNDVWPAIKSALGLLFSQLGLATLNAISANITDPALIPSAVGSALLLTASTTGVADAKTALASATAAVEADPKIQALLTPPPAA
jgi:hypothetical protein